MSDDYYQRRYDALLAMEKQLVDLGVQPLTTFGRLYWDADDFAKLVLLERSQDQVANLTRQQPEQARAFLSVLHLVQREIESVISSPGTVITDHPTIHHLSAEAVLYAVKAFRRRSEGYSGAYLSYPKEDSV